MSKQRLSASEIADLLTTQIGARGIRIDIRRDHADGWHPTVTYAPGNMLGFQRRAEEAAHWLRRQYELTD